MSRSGHRRSSGVSLRRVHQVRKRPTRTNVATLVPLSVAGGRLPHVKGTGRWNALALPVASLEAVAGHPSEEYILYMDGDMTVSQARADLGAVTSRAEYGGETTYLTKHGHRAAAVVPATAAELLEQLEDLVDEQAVQDALASLRSGHEERLPFVRRTRRQTA